MSHVYDLYILSGRIADVLQGVAKTGMLSLKLVEEFLPHVLGARHDFLEHNDVNSRRQRLVIIDPASWC